jgi:hypothetical protein
LKIAIQQRVPHGYNSFPQRLKRQKWEHETYIFAWCKIDDCESGTPPKREHETHIFTWCKIDDCESETPPKQEDETCK